MSVFDDLLQNALDAYELVLVDVQDAHRHKMARIFGEPGAEQKLWRGLQAFLDGPPVVDWRTDGR